MASQTDRYTKILQGIEAERLAEEKYYKELQSRKTVAEKVDSGIVWYPLRIIKKFYTIGDLIEVVLEQITPSTSPHKLKTGGGCELFYKLPSGERIAFSGVISYIRKTKMGVILSGNIHQLSEVDDRYKVGVELVYDERPYHIMTQAINSVIESQQPWIQELREGIRNKQPLAAIKARTSYVPTLPYLNSAQNAAIKGCLSADRMAIIHGPPGTGKTTTLVALIKQLATSEKRILVCAPSNNAIDLLARQLDQIGVRTLRIGHVTRIGDSIAHLSLQEQAANHPDWKNIKKVNIEANEAKRQADGYKRKFGHKERQYRKIMKDEAKELRKWAKQLEQKMIDSIIHSAQAICTTLIGLSHRNLADLQFDTVIIDEASQTLEPECWNAILKSKRVILAGDHKQLPPTVKSPDARALGFDTTLLDRMTDVAHHSYLLTTQYRMNNAILSFSNALFYDNKLIAAPQVADWTLDDQPLTLIDTSGCGFDEEKNPETLSTMNKGEVFIIHEWLHNNDDLLSEDVSIGIISPYSAQIKLLREAYDQDNVYRNKNIEVNTIDGFQGQEKDVIIISLVRSNDHGEIGFVSDPRRLNVAMTRARKKLVIIGDLSTLANHELYNQLADHIDSHGHYLSAWNFM